MQRKELFQKLLKLTPKLIGIDGLGASGKTTLALEIQKLLDEGTIIHTDDFYRPIEQRTIGLVPEIVSPDFDWDLMGREVFKKKRIGTTIVVGVYALQSRFVPYYDFKIWVDAPHEVRLRRMTGREGPAVAGEWQAKWLPREERYLEVDRPDKRADVIYENNN